MEYLDQSKKKWVNQISNSSLSHLGLIDDLIGEGLGDELVLYNGGGVVQGLSHVLVQSGWHVLKAGLKRGGINYNT